MQFFFFFFSLGRLQLRESVVQVSRSVRFLQSQDLLEPTPQLPRDGNEAEGTLRRRYRSPLQQARDFARPTTKAIQPTDEGGPHLPGEVPRLLHLRPRHRVPGDAGPTVPEGLPGHRRMQPAVLRPWLQRLQDEGDGQMSLQVPVVLLCQVQDVRTRCRGVHVQVTKCSAVQADSMTNIFSVI